MCVAKPVCNVVIDIDQILFLNELEEIMELVQMDQFANILRPLFLRLAQSVCSSHFQVSQRALYLWNNESLVRLVSARRAEVLPLIFGALYRNCENHWHRFGSLFDGISRTTSD